MNRMKPFEHLWEFVINVYPVVETELIRLQQEQDLNISLLLFMVWGHYNGIAVSEFSESVKELASKLKQYRILRYSLKVDLMSKPVNPGLYEQLKQCEVGIEKHYLHVLYQCCTEPSDNKARIAPGEIEATCSISSKQLEQLFDLISKPL